MQTITNLDYEFSFGRYKGFLLRDVMQHDPHYVIWLQKNGVCDFDHKLFDSLLYRRTEDDLTDKVMKDVESF